jgi:hypothetical protein
MRKAAVLCARGISCPGMDKRVQANENEYELFANDEQTGKSMADNRRGC